MKNIFKCACPVCHKHFYLKDSKGKTKQRKDAKWWQLSVYIEPRRCPKCGSMIKIKRSSVKIWWLLVPFALVYAWGEVNRNNLQWIGAAGFVVVFFIGFISLKVMKND